MGRGGHITVEVCGRTDVGLEREHNEDSFVLADLATSWRAGESDASKKLDVTGKGLLLAVCDGMGGAAAGEVASGMAVDALFEELGSVDREGALATVPTDEAGALKRREALAELLYKAVLAANLRIWDASVAERARTGMGTTASAITLVDEHLVVAQVGDSRAYLFRHGTLSQVTRDQSLAGALIESGTLDQAQAKDFIHSNVILQALGVEPEVAPTLSSIVARRGDVILICSDGLSGPVDDAEMQDILAAEPDLGKACAALIEAAKAEGAPDNVTVVLARFGGEGLEEPAAEDTRAVVHTFDTTPWEPERPADQSGDDDDDDDEITGSTVNLRPGDVQGRPAAAGHGHGVATGDDDSRIGVIIAVLGVLAVAAGLLISLVGAH